MGIFYFHLRCDNLGIESVPSLNAMITTKNLHMMISSHRLPYVNQYDPTGWSLPCKRYYLANTITIVTHKTTIPLPILRLTRPSVDMKKNLHLKAHNLRMYLTGIMLSQCMAQLSASDRGMVLTHGHVQPPETLAFVPEKPHTLNISEGSRQNSQERTRRRCIVASSQGRSCCLKSRLLYKPPTRVLLVMYRISTHRWGCGSKHSCCRTDMVGR